MGVCQSSTPMWKVCLTICTSPPACHRQSLINREVRYWNSNALGICLVSLQLPERRWILPPHYVFHRTCLRELVLESLCVGVNGIWHHVHSMSGSLSWDRFDLFFWRRSVTLAGESIFLYLSLVLRCMSELQKVWEYTGSSIIIMIIDSLVAGICSWVSFVQPFTSETLTRLNHNFLCTFWMKGQSKFPPKISKWLRVGFLFLSFLHLCSTQNSWCTGYFWSLSFNLFVPVILPLAFSCIF